jgi:drug/metabolite transporter (DMT)-like permease
MALGVAAALFACACWALVFVAVLKIAPYSTFDLAAVRYAIALAISLPALAVAVMQRRQRPTRADWLVTLAVGTFGYTGYFIAASLAVLFAGPVLPTLIVGVVPIMVGLIGNWREGMLPWSRLAGPLALVAAGLATVNLEALLTPALPTAASSAEMAAGIALAIAAVIAWTWCAIVNADALRRRPEMGAGLWTAMIGIGTGASMTLVLPFGWLFGWSRIGEFGLLGPVAAPLWGWALTLALLVSYAATWVWSIALRRLPVTLSGQLIVSSTLFALAYGLALEGRWPTPAELAGSALLVAGVWWAIVMFNRATTGAAARAASASVTG